MNRCLERWRFAVIALLFLVLARPVAVAQSTADLATRAAARDLAVQGIRAYQAGEYDSASLTLEKAYRLFATPTLGLWSARASVQRGLWIEAAERYRETLRLQATVGDTDMQQKAQKDAAAELESLEQRLPAVSIQLVDTTASGVTLRVDDSEVPIDLLGVRRPINPGKHIVAAIRSSELGEAQFQISEREHKTVELRMSDMQPKAAAPVVQPAVEPSALPEPRTAREQPDLVPTHSSAADAFVANDASPPPFRPIAIGALVAGGAGLLTSGVTALLAQGKCSGGRCATESDRGTYDPLRTVSSIAFWAGAALAVAGTATWLLAPSQEQPTSKTVSVAVSPFGVYVSGTL